MFGDAFWWRLFRTSGHGIGNAQLQWAQLQRHDSCIARSLATGVGNAPQAPPNQHIAAGTDASTRIHITKYQHRTIDFEMFSSSDGAAMNVQFTPGTFQLFWLGGGFSLAGQAQGCRGDQGAGFVAGEAIELKPGLL